MEGVVRLYSIFHLAKWLMLLGINRKINKMKIQPEEQYKFLKISLPDGVSANEHSVLLHACCAPCSAAIVECMLRNGIRPTVYFPIPISILNRSLIFESMSLSAFCNSRMCPTWKTSTTMLTGKRL